MRAEGLPFSIWGQQVILWIVLSICFWTANRPGVRLDLVYTVIAVIGLMLLPLTFLDSGLQGVHRYISFGVLKLNVGEAFLPAILVVLLTAWKNRPAVSLCAILLIIITLTLQPDSSKATAFVAALFIFGWLHYGRLTRLVLAIIALIVISAALIQRDPLGRVPHAEDILRLAWNRSSIWGIAALSSLLVLLAPFIPREREPAAVALFVYFAVSLLMLFVGNFPIPVLGYGAAGMIGYFLGLGGLILLEENSIHSAKKNDSIDGRMS